jgi:very-short-patch-repair endonuclease
MDIEFAVFTFGGVANFAQLRSFGIDSAAARDAISLGLLHRVRRGWVALPSADTDTVRAVRVGGHLSCVSVLRAHDVWCRDDGLLHVRVSRYANHLASPRDRRVSLSDDESAAVVVHHDFTRRSLVRDPACDEVETALLHLVTCQNRDDAIVAFDSALNLHLAERPRLQRLADGLSIKHREVMRLCDGTAQSGLETMARLRLHALGIPYRSQALVPGAGHVDLLVGERMVLEVDGKKWHSGVEAFAEDRRRDLELHERGYSVLRFSYAQVVYQWPRIEALIRSMVSRREHLWSARHIRAGLGR